MIFSSLSFIDDRYHFNDTKVSEIDKSEICTRDAYVLFYNKVSRISLMVGQTYVMK